LNIQLREIFYVSNLLSLVRMVLLLPIYHFLTLQSTMGNYIAAGLMVAAVATDSLDGRLARRLNQRSDLGRILDPLADKVAVAVVAILLVQIRDLPLWFVLLVVGRDVMIMVLSLMIMSRANVVAESLTIGKVTVTALAAVILAFTLDLAVVKWVFMWCSVALVVISGVVYFVKMKQIITQEQIS